MNRLSRGANMRLIDVCYNPHRPEAPHTLNRKVSVHNMRTMDAAGKMGLSVFQSNYLGIFSSIGKVIEIYRVPATLIQCTETNAPTNLQGLDSAIQTPCTHDIHQRSVFAKRVCLRHPSTN